jgi:molybdopterin-guanine dinucleotide biosynthesis protein A
MDKVRAVSGIILAGGQSRRMGAPKALIPYRGKPLISWVYEALRPICSEILIISNSGDFRLPDARVIPDNYPGNGPAGGIEAGLAAMRYPVALLSSCDTPNLTTGLFEYLIDNHLDYEISIASHEGITEPLIGAYSLSALAAFRRAILAGDPHPPRIISGCHWQALEVPAEPGARASEMFLNLNTPDDLRK